MDIYVMNTNFEVVGVLDTYSSLLWTDRLKGYGDFEIYTPFDKSILDICKQNYYLSIDLSDRTMIVEGIEIITDAETGNNLRIIGRSLESILDRRIIWNPVTLSGNVETVVQTVLNGAFISPSRSERRIPNFKYQALPTGHPLKSLEINSQKVSGDNVYTMFKELCDVFYRYGFGFKILLDDNYDFVFSLYTGVKRTYDQDAYPYVIFSPEFENVINTNYLNDMSTYKNVTLVVGENSKRLIVGSGTGLDRRELYTDAQSLRYDEFGTKEKYQKALRSEGVRNLAENCRTVSYEGEVEAKRQFEYGKDFFIGDVIQIENEYGISGTARVIEWVISDSESGFDCYPTFDSVQDINEDYEEDGGW